MDDPTPLLNTPYLIKAHEIWNFAPHNAFSDLMYFKGQWYCTFRESNKHEQGNNGSIRIIRSVDTLLWESDLLFESSTSDLRDPKLSITPSGSLMLLMTSVKFDENKKYVFRESLVSFTEDGFLWTPFRQVLKDHDWLWKVTWDKGIAYGVSYTYSNLLNFKKEWLISLWKSSEGIDFEELTSLKVHGRPNETTLRFLPSGEMIALVRRNKRGCRGCCIGSSFPPYKKWKWKKTRTHLGGPNFLLDEYGRMWASGRMMFLTPYGGIYKTVVGLMTTDQIYPKLILPSDGDTGYSGMVMKNGELWVSYHTSIKEKTSIYLARIKLPSI